MFGSFLPPVVFEITANATEAIASFNKVNTSLKTMEAQALKTGIAVTKMQKATVMATGFLKGFGLVAAAVGAVGVHEFMKLEKNMTFLGQAMANAGVNTAAYRKQVEETIIAQERLAFDAGDTSKAMAVLVTATGDVNKSTKLMQVSMDLARFKTISIEEAARQVARGTQGAAKAFKEFGITLDTTKPKAEAAQEAIDKLSKRLAGTAEAYLKTFKGQMELLGVQLQNFAEAIGAVVVPALNKLLSGIRAVFDWLSKHKEVLVAIGVVMTGALVTAIGLVTKKLYAQAVAWAALNWEITLVIAGFALLTIGFIKTWNASENVRKVIIYLGKGFINFGKLVTEVVGTLVNGFLLIVRGSANAQIAIGKLTGDKEKVKTGKATLDWIDETNAKIKDLIDGFDKANSKWTGLQFSKIDLSKFSIPGLAKLIPDFTNGAKNAADSTNKLSDALVTAKQKIIDFNNALKDTAINLASDWTKLVGTDIAQAIENGLLNPIDQLVVKTQKAVDSYQTASNDYEKALTALTAAQDNYTKALSGTNKAAQAAAESALKVAETTVNDINDVMSAGLQDLMQYQDQMVQAVIGAYNDIKDLETKRTEIQAQATEDRLALEKDYNAKVKDLKKQYDRDVANAQLEAAKRTAELVKQSVDQLRGIYKTATYRTVGDIFQSLTFQGRYMAGGTTEKILAALGLQSDKAKKLAGDAATLAGLGFSQTFIEEVVAQGPDVGDQLAQTIINSSPESIKQMKAYWTDLQNTASHGVDTLANELNNGMTLATEELTAQLAEVKSTLDTNLITLAQDFQDALTVAFNDYSDALEAINKKTAKQVLDINGQIDVLKLKIAQLQNALVTLSGLNAPGTSAPRVDLGGAVEEFDNSLITPELKDIFNSFTGDAMPGFINFGDTLNDFANTLKSNTTSTSSTLTTTNTTGLPNNKYGGANFDDGGKRPTITVIANTNASADDIANKVAWTIKTSNDIQYVTSGGMGGTPRMFE